MPPSGLPRARHLIVLAVLGAVGGAVWWSSRPEPIDVLVADVARGPVEQTVANTRAGTVKACRRAKLSPSVGGQIARLPVSEGDHVKQGQLLLELWNDDLAAELTLAERETRMSEENARAACLKAAEAEREAERQRKLRERRLASEEAVDRAVTAAATTAADCEAARHQSSVREARMAVIRADLEKTRLLAPFDGVVAEINGELNEYVTPSPIGIQTPPAVDLIDTSCFYVTAPIDEVDVGEVALDQTARVTLDAFAGREFDGKVRRIADFVLDEEKQARTVDVEVEFDADGETRLLAGYSADVEIIIERHDDVLRLPTEAVLEGNAVYLFDANAGTVQRRTIQTGLSNWDHTEVLGGLAEGARVVTSVGREGLTDGVPARLDADADE
jgi:HlyD family secretion protein